MLVTAKFSAPWSGPGSSDLYPHSAYAADAHQLEEDEQVEEVAGLREAVHGREEDQHQAVEQRSRPCRSSARRRSAKPS